MQNRFMKYLYTILIIGLLLILWFAPIDLDRERQLASNGPRMLILFILERTWVKVVFSVFLGLIVLGLHNKEEGKS